VPDASKHDVAVGNDGLDDGDDTDWLGNPNPLARDVATSTNLGWDYKSTSLGQRDRSRALAGFSGAISRLTRAADYASSAVLNNERPGPDGCTAHMDASTSIKIGVTGEIEDSTRLNNRSGLAGGEDADISLQDTFASPNRATNNGQELRSRRLSHGGSSLSWRFGPELLSGSIPEDLDDRQSPTRASQWAHAKSTPPHTPPSIRGVLPTVDPLTPFSDTSNYPGQMYVPPMHRSILPSPVATGTPMDSGVLFVSSGKLPPGNVAYHNSMFNAPSVALSPRFDSTVRAKDDFLSPVNIKPNQSLPHANTQVNFGRPDIHALFAAAAAQAKELGEERVALLICSNKHVLLECLEEAQWRQGTQVDFDVHYEAFGF
jgi:hypothetical protein